MSESNYHELRLKQTELFVARQIFDELKSDQDLYIKPLPLDNIASGEHIFPDYGYQHTGLQRLVEKGFIEILNPGVLLSPGIHIHIVDVSSFMIFYTDLFESIPSHGYGARIVYSRKSGSGKVNGKPFKFNSGSRNRKVFGYIAKHPNEYLTKEKLWVIAGEKGKFTEDDSDKVQVFNTIITSLREGLKSISPKQLRLKKRVILDAEVTLTD